MDARRRAAADAVSRRNAAYPAGGDVLDTVFNRILLASSVCPSSAVSVWESAVFVRLDPPQHFGNIHTWLSNNWLEHQFWQKSFWKQNPGGVGRHYSW